MMKQHTSSRLFLTAIIALFACVSISGQNYLNPFAYRLDNMVDRNTYVTDDSKGLLMNDHYVIKYALSGPATSVIVRFWDITEGREKSTWSRNGGNTGTYLFEFNITDKEDANGKLCNEKGYHEYTIDFTHVIGKNGNLDMTRVRWTIDVTGGNTNVDDYSPRSVTLKNATSVTAKSNSLNATDKLKEEISKDQIAYSTTQKNFNFSNAKLVTEYVPFRYPGGVDICNDPYNHNFGAIFCVESYRVSDETDVEGPSKGIEPGLYVLGGGMELLKSRWNNNYANRYEGPGWDNTTGRFGTIKAVAPGRVRLTDDNRLFISALSNAEDASSKNRILYEVKRPATKNTTSENNFYNCPTNGGSWDEVFISGKWIFDTEKAQYQTSGGSYIAAPNMGFDVRNRDGNLQLIMLAAEHGAIKQSTREYYHIDRYNLGAASTWSNTPTYHQTTPNDGRVTTKVHHGAIASIVGRDMTNIEYDPQGGYWIAQYRATPAGPLAITMLHVTKNGVIDIEEHAMNRNRGAIRHNHDYTKLIVPGGIITDTIMHKLDANGNNLDNKYYSKATVNRQYTFSFLETSAINSDAEQAAYDGARFFAAKTCRENQYTIYDVSYDSDGMATLSNPVYVDASGIGRTSVRDFAWDFGNNLYVASYTGHGLYAFALPNKNKTVSTPCRSEYEYTLAPVHEFYASVNPTVKDADPYATITHTRIDQPPYEHYLNNAKMDLVANVIDGCKFYKWTTYGWPEPQTKPDYKELRTYPQTNGNKFLVNTLTEQLEVIAEIGLCVYEDTKVLDIEKETTFPAAFVKRELDNANYSTICLPFDLKTLEGTPWEGASVLRMNRVYPSGEVKEGEEQDLVTYIDFVEVGFTESDYMQAYRPYLIKLADNAENISKEEEKIFIDAHCPKNNSLNSYGGITDGNLALQDVVFHGVLNPSTIANDENTLFLVADNRLAKIVGKDEVSLNGLRAFFTVNPEKVGKIELRLPDKTVTSVPTFSIDTLKPTKYLWNGKIYIQRGNNVYDLSGNCVK